VLRHGCAYKALAQPVAHVFLERSEHRRTSSSDAQALPRAHEVGDSLSVLHDSDRARLYVDQHFALRMFDRKRSAVHHDIGHACAHAELSAEQVGRVDARATAHELQL
jgi:hypothetical protein